MNEFDVFPIENGDFPGRHATFQDFQGFTGPLLRTCSLLGVISIFTRPATQEVICDWKVPHLIVTLLLGLGISAEGRGGEVEKSWGLGPRLFSGFFL